MHRLSNYIELSSDLNKNNELEYFVFVTKNKSKLFLINETIFSFLKNFEIPNSLELLINYYVNNLELKLEKDLTATENQLTSFFNELVRRKWLVKEDEIEPPIVFETQLNANDDIINNTVKSVFANNKRTDVYLVKHRDNNKTTVVKLLNRDKFKNEESYTKAEKYFQNEYNYLTKFNSIYINKTFGIHNFKNQPFIVLEYIKGVSLYKFIKHNTLNSQQKISLVLKILKGFSIIHKANVYHGDIHLSNVLVKENHLPKIIDFGYSNDVKVLNQDHKNVRNGGVFAFIPPERAIRSIDHRFTKVTQFQSEVYQIGLLIYYIFVKELPFKSETWKTMVDEKKAFDIETNHPFLNRRMPKSVRRIISKSLENIPENRHKDAHGLLFEWKKLIK